jgi:hypothetical protein
MLNNIINITLEVLTGLFSGSNEELEQNETYKYWLDLSYQEQEEYFSNNEYLKDYMKNDFYANDRKLTAKHVAQIADKLNRQFTNKYDRY